MPICVGHSFLLCLPKQRINKPLQVLAGNFRFFESQKRPAQRGGENFFNKGKGASASLFEVRLQIPKEVGLLPRWRLQRGWRGPDSFLQFFLQRPLPPPASWRPSLFNNYRAFFFTQSKPQRFCFFIHPSRQLFFGQRTHFLYFFGIFFKKIKR